ncbi:hypothetical protein [Blastopirellula marina]|uniref:Uncharacterized protein n=1 Tax=Blastopirellula marina TaxID=124 RepID=A0A2S8G8I0_9BACT|nr:hypothetical protein [Blastopirellula marina]PQO40733.1 hypothetical protein C5Y98_05820 [Blastopirellula marina]PTL45693.1 hypothetical protein C5Y97_05820 [Blastopirellula marina]
MKGRDLAIAEWPTQNGPADYGLFVGLKPVAVVKAKRTNKNCASAIVQAKTELRETQRVEIEMTTTLKLRQSDLTKEEALIEDAKNQALKSFDERADAPPG